MAMNIAYIQTTLSEIEEVWQWIMKNQAKSYGHVELWEIEEDRNKNRYAIITRYQRKRKGREPLIKFLRKIRET